MVSAKQILQQYWHHDNFRGLQEDIINSVLEKKDVLALLPTGGGKSICFQVPALMNNGLCLVISPLIALMKDQVQNLHNKNIAAVAIYSGMTGKEVEQVFIDVSNRKYKFLYLSPERLQSKLFKSYLNSLNISLIAVDEAHCISQWGYDFRPPYLKIIDLREALPQVPIIALTASATKIVQNDILEKLKLKEPQIFQQSFERDNISYSVFKVDSKIHKALEILNNVAGSSIVYCKNRRQTNDVAQLLKLQNISADYYHAGLTQEERNQKQANWISNSTRVVVCTNAFGMGIDKPDVKSVIHYDTPDCLENYYQEAGRAGRDGKRAFAVLLYHSTEINELTFLPNIRFPSIDDIKKVYQSLANFLQIPVGIGEGNYYDFDIIAFTKNFNIDIHLALNVLKTLEHEGHITVTENIYIPSKAKFTTDKYSIEAFENSNPKLEPVIKCLLRTYYGILENSISINEKLIAKLCRLPYEIIYKSLNILHKYGIIEYTPQKETPQIYFNFNRADVEGLTINHADYFKRKQQFIVRVDAMLNYLNEKKVCRSQIISNYFNAGNLQDCGSCDNCLAKKTVEISSKEFNIIKLKLFELISTDSISTDVLLSHFKTIKKDKFWKVLQFLQDEKLIVINQNGIVTTLQ
ncbi:MAG: RecQ family ATP-dependent DNA helicase [Chitinophagaceae bacterium]